MADYASIMGGAAPHNVIGQKFEDLDAVGRNWDAYYHLDSTNVFLDRFGSSGNSLVDARGNTGGANLELGSGSDTVTGGTGNDSIWAGAGNDTVMGGRGDDTAPGGPDGSNTVSGGSGNDLLVGGAGNDSLSGGVGDDTVRAGLGDDYVVGGAGADSLRGDAGDDSLFGGSGDDLLYGQDGADMLVGGTGADLLMGGAGDDALFGGSGRDVFAFDSGFGQDVISDFGPGDRINLAAHLNGTTIQDAKDLLTADGVAITGGTTAAGTKFTVIAIGGDTIRLEKMDHNEFISQITTWVKVG